MSTETGWEHEPAWPQPTQQQLVRCLEHRSRELQGRETPRVGHQPIVSWNHRCLAIMPCLFCW